MKILRFKTITWEATQYRTHHLRELSFNNKYHGGLEGRYRKLVARGQSRAVIAKDLGLSEPALDYWVRKWNKQKNEHIQS